MQRIFESMLHATFYPGGELSAIGPSREFAPSPQQVYREPVRISDGPQIQAGPFVLPAGQKLEGFKIYLWKKQIANSRTHRAIANWAVDAIWQVSQNHGWDNTVAYSEWKAGPGSATAPFAVDGKSLWAKERLGVGMGQVPNPTGKNQILYPKFNQSDGIHDVNVGGYWVSAPGAPGTVRGVGCVYIPDNQVWGVNFFTGKSPIAKFKHPVTKKDWCIYCLITGDGFEFTFKERETHWWEDIWNWLVNLVAKLIEYVSDIFEFLKDMVACPLARQNLDKLAKYATEQTPGITSELTAVSAATGIPAYSLQEAIDSGESQAVQAVAGQIVDKLCGPPPAVAKQYPKGAVQALNPVTKRWIIAVPKVPLSGALGTSPDGTEYKVYEEGTNKAVTVVTISYDDLKKYLRPPWYKSPWFWGSVAVIGTGGVVVWRWRRKRRA
jgi:hypothetical protein